MKHQQWIYRQALVALTVAILSILGACATITHPSLTAEKPVSLAETLSLVDRAEFDDYARRPHARVQDAAAFSEMKTHLRTLYSGVSATHSFLGRDNQFVDCIPNAQQAGLRNPRTGPAPLLPLSAAPEVTRALTTSSADSRGGERSRTQQADLTLNAGVKDKLGAEMYCVSGTIPMRRVTLDEMVRFKNLRAFLSKSASGGTEGPGKVGNDGPRAPNDQTHYYGRGVQFVDNFGGDSWLNVWSPIVANHEMSLSQIWVVGTDNPKQTVEAGWQVYPDKWSSSNAGLFIFYTTNNYADGCYNLDCSGFVQMANNVYLGSGFDHYSTRDGGQWGFNLQYKRGPDGTWWLFYKGAGDYITVGYYPKSLFGEGALSRRANKIAWGGEDTGSPSSCEMGSGAFPRDGFGKAAYQDTVFYIDTNVESQWPTLSAQEVPDTCYRADIHNFSDNGQKSFLYFGGPRRN